MTTPRYAEGDRVMLAVHEDQPREPATVLTADVYGWGIGYVVEVDEHADEDDDGLREVTEDQIEGPLLTS